MRRKLKNFWMHPNENLCRSLDLFGQDVYHNRTMLPPRETMLGSNLCKRTLQRCLCTNLPQFRRYSDRPNISGGWLSVLAYNQKDSESPYSMIARFPDYIVTTKNSTGASWQNTTFSFNAGDLNPIYGSATTVQVSALRSLCLIRAY